jgi:hypothetical protein
MCAFTATHFANEVLVRYSDGTVWVAFERSCGCTGLRAATLGDLSRGLALLEATPDSDQVETADEPAGVPELALAA